MALNLLTDPWIPARTTAGPQIIRPDQIAQAGVLMIDWPRADLNIACLEFLVGLVYLADPPVGNADWKGRPADPIRLKERLASFATAFNLGGEGPKFLQDLEILEGEPSPPDMLFIDSAGGNTIKNNADLMVRGGRYPQLDAPMAAMALYTLQAHAPSGGAGNRTSMRGGGPMVCIIDPQIKGSETPLWDKVWANVPTGKPQGLDALPWMRDTVSSEKGQQVHMPEGQLPAEVFFGMPRRLRLVWENDVVTGVIQRPYGTNYAGWRHPLTPYYRVKEGAELLPRHPSAGTFGYRDWLGIVLEKKDNMGLRERPETLVTYLSRGGSEAASLQIAGWAMDNMKPRDFTLSRQPLIDPDGPAEFLLRGVIEAGTIFADALRGSLKPVLGKEGHALAAAREAFLLESQPMVEAATLATETELEDVARQLHHRLGRLALRLFEDRAIPGLADRAPKDIDAITTAHGWLRRTTGGWTKQGVSALEALGLEPPSRKKEDV
jgi:CRISPR system Cascade subunit CasA